MKIPLQLGVGAFATGFLIWMGQMGAEAYDIAVHNAFVAAAHAEIDGEVIADGYLPLPEESQSRLGGIAELSPSQPEDPSAAVTAHQTRAAVSMEVANDYKNDIRWWWGGAGVVFLLTARSTYAPVADWLRRRWANVNPARNKQAASPTRPDAKENRSLEEN